MPNQDWYATAAVPTQIPMPARDWEGEIARFNESMNRRVQEAERQQWQRLSDIIYAPEPTPAPEPAEQVPEWIPLSWRASAPALDISLDAPPSDISFDEARAILYPSTVPTVVEDDAPLVESSRAYIPRAVRNDWRTPDNVLDVVRAALGGTIALDPCASTEHWLAGGDEIGEVLNFHEEDDGLALDWQAKLLAEAGVGEAANTVYVNPPFNANAKWMAKCAEEAAKGLEIIALIPARVDTRYWHNIIAKTAKAVAFWRGRIRFVGATNSAPFPCALIYWGPNAARFETVLERNGHHVP